MVRQVHHILEALLSAPANKVERLLIFCAFVFLTSCIEPSAKIDSSFRDTADSLTGEIGNSAISFTPASFDFGDIAVGSSSSFFEVTLTNTTSSILFIEGFVLSSDIFRLVGGDCPSSESGFDPDSSCKILLQFSPTRSGEVGAALIASYGVSENNPSEFSSSMGVSGSGVGVLAFDGIESIDNITNNSMRLNWSANEDATAFFVYDTSSGNMVYHGNVSNTGGSVSTYEATGLNPSTTYSWRVRGIDSLGDQEDNTEDLSASTSANGSPALNAIADPTVFAAISIADINASDSNSGDDADIDGDELSYVCFYDNTDNDSVDATNACTSLINEGGGNPNFDAQTGVFSGWSPRYADTTSTFEFRITATDPYGASDSVFFSATVQPGLRDNDGSVNGFGGGSHLGTQWDSTNNILRLGDDGGCNGLTKNCAELDASWTPKWNDLVAYWKMNNDWVDSKGSNDGTPEGQSTFTGSSKIGTHSATLDGTGDYVNIGALDAVEGRNEIAISVWLKQSRHHEGGIFSKGPLNNLTLTTWTDGRFYFDIGNSTTGRVSTGAIVPVNRWYHLVATNDGTDSKIYVDGREVATAAISTTIASGNLPAILATYRSNLTTLTYEGQMDDFAIWRSGLDQDEVKLIFERQRAKYSGEFRSRVLNYGSSINWAGISWITKLPFLKNLTADANDSGTITPADSESSDDYEDLVGSTGSTGDDDLMDDIVANWSFEEPAAGLAPGGTDFTDYSATANHLTVSGALTFDQVSPLGRSAYFDGEDANYLNAGTSDIYDIETGDFSVQAWFKTESNATTTSLVSKSLYGAAAGRWFMILQSGKIRATTTFTGGSGNTETTDTFNDGEWHHAVFVLDRSDRIILYVDGEEKDSASVSAYSAQNLNSTYNLLIGAYNNSSGGLPPQTGLNFEGQIDEVAIWKRALHEEEVRQLYRRGVDRIKFQVRTCTSDDCSDDAAWIGPDNTSESYFSELHNTAQYNYETNNCSASALRLVTSPSLLFECFTSMLAGLNPEQYFQYRAILESDDTNQRCNFGSGNVNCSPELQQVEVFP